MLSGISEREEDILQAVYLHRYVTKEQIVRLFFAPGSKNYVGEFLKHLTERKYLSRFYLPQAKKGTPPFVYCLSDKGFSYLKGLGYAEHGFIRQKEQPSYLHLTHIQGLNDLLITARLLPRVESRISDVSVLPDWIIKKMVCSAQMKQMKEVIPDAIMHIRALIQGQKRRMVVWMEYDRETEGRQYFVQKVQKLMTALLTPEYVALFGAGVVGFVTMTEKRCADLRGWAGDTLEKMRCADKGVFFLFSSLEQCNGSNLFIGNVWQSPFYADLLPLVSL